MYDSSNNGNGNGNGRNRTRRTTRHLHDASQEPPQEPSRQDDARHHHGEQPFAVHKTGRLLPGGNGVGTGNTPDDRAARAAREAQAAWEQAQRENRLARLYAAGIRARAEERRREIWEAMDTGPLMQLVWPRPTPQPVPRRPTGSLGDPEVLLSTQLPAPGQSPLRFHLYERVYYSVAGEPSWLARVEGWRRESTGDKYFVRKSIQRQHPTLGRVLEWDSQLTEVWEDFLTSDEDRARERAHTPRPHMRRMRRTMPLLPPPSTPSKP